MSIIGHIKITYSYAIAKECSEAGCKLKLKGLKEYVILKGEKIACKKHKICDYIIFTLSEGYIYIGVVELKSKTVHVEETIEKLRKCSDIAIDILEQFNNNLMNSTIFFHIILSKRLHTSEHEVITKRRIIVRGKKYPIIPQRCGVYFYDIICNF